MKEKELCLLWPFTILHRGPMLLQSANLAQHFSCCRILNMCLNLSAPHFQFLL